MQRRGWAIARVVGRWYFHHGVSDWFLYDLRSVGVQDECRLRAVVCAQFEGYFTEEGAAFLWARWYATMREPAVMWTLSVAPEDGDSWRTVKD